MGGYCQGGVEDHHLNIVKEISRQPITSLEIQENRLGPKERPKLLETRQHAQRLQP